MDTLGPPGSLLIFLLFLNSSIVLLYGVCFEVEHVQKFAKYKVHVCFVIQEINVNIENIASQPGQYLEHFIDLFTIQCRSLYHAVGVQAM